MFGLLCKIKLLLHYDCTSIKNKTFKIYMDDMKIINYIRDNFELILKIDDNFCNPPKDNQRNWILNRTLKETADNLVALNHLCKKFVNGAIRPKIESEQWSSDKAVYKDGKELIINNQQVMQSWELPYMREMAKIVSQTKGDILEIGFGMGISSTFIQEAGVRSHTIIECNDDVINFFNEWKKQYSDRKITLIKGKWQDVINKTLKFDGIFFDSYPVSEDEHTKYVIKDATFAQHFFETAYNHLHDGGIFTYYSSEINTVSRAHQRELFKYFKEITFTVCKPLFPPQDCTYWWADSMIAVKAIK